MILPRREKQERELERKLEEERRQREEEERRLAAEAELKRLQGWILTNKCKSTTYKLSRWSIWQIFSFVYLSLYNIQSIIKAKSDPKNYTIYS